MRDSVLKALSDFSDAAYNLLIAWDTNMPSTDNDFSEETNELLFTAYPFDKDFTEVAHDIIDWKWSVIYKAKNIRR